MPIFRQDVLLGSSSYLREAVAGFPYVIRIRIPENHWPPKIASEPVFGGFLHKSAILVVKLRRCFRFDNA